MLRNKIGHEFSRKTMHKFKPKITEKKPSINEKLLETDIDQIKRKIPLSQGAKQLTML